MLKMQRSPAASDNQTLKKIRRATPQDNVAYVAEHASRSEGDTNVILVGGVGSLDFRLRVAQSHARDDMAPSAWSHLFFIGAPTATGAGTEVFEVSLAGKSGVGYPPASNGVMQTVLEDYADPKQFPNIAVLQVPVALAEVLPVIEGFKRQRTMLDAVEHLLVWWGYTWGVGRAANPLLDGVGIPSAAFVEYALAMVGYDLVPGFPSRSSCPEAIWQSARWWFEHPRMVESEATTASEMRAIRGAFDAEHYLVPAS